MDKALTFILYWKLHLGSRHWVDLLLNLIQDKVTVISSSQQPFSERCFIPCCRVILEKPLRQGSWATGSICVLLMNPSPRKNELSTKERQVFQWNLGRVESKERFFIVTVGLSIALCEKTGVEREKVGGTLSSQEGQQVHELSDVRLEDGVSLGLFILQRSLNL